MAGLDASGFTGKTFAEIQADMQADCDVQFGASNASRTPMSVMAIFVFIISALAAALWQLGRLIYNSQRPSGAFGALLDGVLELTGMTRLAETKSTVNVVCVGTNATVLATGRRIKNSVTNTYWVSTGAATIATQSAWASSTAYAVGDMRTNDSGKLYVCVDDGTSAGSGGPTGTGTSIVDGSVTWRYVATATAAALVPFESELYGQIVGAAGNLSVIETAQSGWSSCVNPLDADQGRSIETDAQARIRRLADLRSTGNSAVDAIRADVSAVPGVERVIVFKNDTDAVDGDGVPAHAFELLVQGGDDQAIADAILATGAAGIQAHGDDSYSVTDAEGTVLTVKFSRPEVLTVYLEVDIVIDADEFPVDGDAQVKQAIVDFSEGLAVGGVTFDYGRLDISDDVIPDHLRTPPKQIAGVTYVSAIRLGTSPSPVSTSILSVTRRQVADLDTSRILVTHV